VFWRNLRGFDFDHADFSLQYPISNIHTLQTLESPDSIPVHSSLQLKPVAGRAQQGDLGVEDDVHRETRQQVRQASLIPEGLHERPLLQGGQNARGNAAAQVLYLPQGFPGRPVGRLDAC